MSSSRKNRLRHNATLWGAQLLVTALRAIFRVREFFAPPREKQRLQFFRAQMEMVERMKAEALAKLKAGDIEGGILAVDKISDRLGCGNNKQECQERSEWRRHIAEIREEGEALERISVEAPDDLAKAEAYRDYVKKHPTSSIAWTWLAGSLRKIGSLDESLAAFREAERLHGPEGRTVLMTRINIGEVLADKGEFVTAVTHLQEVIATAENEEPYASIAHVCLGDVLQKSGDIKGARTAWKEALRRDQSGALKKFVKERLKR